jgi:outer membrane protein OmpU
MKKLLAAAALASLMSTSALADVTIGGDFEYSVQDSNGTTTSAVDADLNIKPSITTDTGLTFGADFNINQDGNDDGGNSLNIAGSFGKVQLGDVDSALDAIDDVTDFGYVVTNGSPSSNHAAILSITPFAGATVHVSGAADSNYGSASQAGYGFAGTYAIGEVATVGYGKLENDDKSSETIMNVQGTLGPIGLGYEKHTATTTGGVDTDTTTMGGSFTVQGVTLAVETMKAESAGTVSSDEISLGAHYTVAPGLVAFVEYTEDDKTASEETTAIGLSMKF